MVFQLALLVVPPALLVATYFLTTFPHPPESLLIYPSLSSLPESSSHWLIYSEDFIPGGAYVQFPYGKVRYWLLGPEDGTKVVLIHGLSIPSMVWQETAPQLAARGCRVLVYDVYGRGYSDAPKVTYNAEFLSTQLSLLFQHLHWEKANIVGMSMGGAIAAAFANHFPGLVDDKLVLICSAGLIEPRDISKTVKLMSSPLVQWFVSWRAFTWYIQRLALSRSTNPTKASEEVVRIQSAFLPGYNHAIASSIRYGPIRGQASSFSSNGFANKSVLLIHGTEDRSVPYKQALQIKYLLPDSASVQLVTVEGGGHEIIKSHSTSVIGTLTEFLV